MEFFLTSLTVTFGVLFVIYIRNKVKRNDLELIEKRLAKISILSLKLILMVP